MAYKKKIQTKEERNRSLEVGSFLRHLRKKFALTQDFIAKKIGVSRPTLNKIELGKAEISLIQAQKLADFYNVPIQNLLISVDSIQKDTRKSLLFTDLKEERPKILNEKRLSLKYEILLLLCTELMGFSNISENDIKILFFMIDVESMKIFKQPLIGFNYTKGPNGPIPANWQDFLNDMLDGNLIVKVNNQFFKYPNNKILPLKEANMSLFYGNELHFIFKILTEYKNYSIEDRKKKLDSYIEYKNCSLYKTINY